MIDINRKRRRKRTSQRTINSFNREFNNKSHRYDELKKRFDFLQSYAKQKELDFVDVTVELTNTKRELRNFKQASLLKRLKYLFKRRI